MQVTALFALLVLLALVLAGAGLAAYRLAAWQRQAQDGLKRALVEADAQRERLFAVLRSVPHGLLVLDERDRVAVANEQAAALWGLAGGEIAGLSLYTLEQREAFRRGEQPWRLVDALARQEVHANDTLATVEVEAIASGCILEVVATPVWPATGDGSAGTVVLFRDVTEARRLEQMREDLTHMLVHDLRTPLSAIYTGVMALLSDEQMDRETIGRVLGLAESNARRMLHMVETLVDIGRLEARQMPVEKEPVEVHALFEEAVDQVAPQAQAKGIHVDVEVSPDLVTWVDPGLIERVLVNLLGNAVKFTPQGGRVELRGQEDGDGILLWVRDSGPGILPEDQARIFDRFTQAGQRRQWGSGLGLAFCKLAVEAVAAGDVGETLSALAALLEGGADARVMRRQLVGHLRSAMVAAAGVELPGPSGLESLAGAGVEKLLRWLSALVEVKPHGADDRTGLELALVRAVIGPQVAPTPGLAAILPGEARGQAAARSSPRSPRQAAGPPATEPQSERSTDNQARVDQQPAQEDTGSEVVVPEPSPSPTIPRRLDALQAHWDEVLAGMSRSGHVQIQALLRSCTPVAVDDRQVVVAARYGFHRTRLEDDEARQTVEQALAAVIGEPVELQVILADEIDAPAPPQAAGGQDDAGLPAGLPSEMADDPLLRVAVQELGAVVRTV